MATKKTVKKKGKEKKETPKKISKTASAQPVATAPAEITYASTTSNEFTKERELSKTEKMARLRALRNEVGTDLLFPADEVENQYMIRRPTGVIELDIALGGGFPAGGASVIGGPFNSGKSWLLWRIFAMQQQIYGNDFMGAVHIAEHPLMYDQALSAGCRISVPDNILQHWDESRRMHGWPALTEREIQYAKTQVGHFEIIGGVTGEEVLTTVIKCIETGAFSVVGVDSASALQPYADMDKELTEEQKRGAHATMMKKFWNKYVPLTRKGKNPTSLILTNQATSNQERANMPSHIQKYIPEWVVRLSKASEHYNLITLVMWTGEKIRHPSTKEVIGKWVKYNTQKGKAGTHDNISGEYPYYYHLNGVDTHGELIASGLRRGIIAHSGNHLAVLRAGSHEPIPNLVFGNEMRLREAMATSFDLELAIRQEILASANVQCLYR